MGPMVEFIAQMIEYNETLTIYQNFIEKIDFFSKFFFDPWGPQGASWGYRELSGTENSMKNDGLKGFFKKCWKNIDIHF